MVAILPYFIINNISKPKLMSVIRLSMNSGHKDYSFYKDEHNMEEVTAFVALVESELIKLHKNN